MTLGDVIKQYRIEHQMSMDKFAKASGLSKAYVGMLEKNVNPTTGRPVTPSIVTVKCVSQATGIDFDTLLDMLDSEYPISLATFLPTTNKEPENSEEADFDLIRRMALRVDIELILDSGGCVVRKGNLEHRLTEDEYRDLVYDCYQYVEYRCEKMLKKTKPRPFE